jgi:hypothetical protein
MNVTQARAVARQWVLEEASPAPGFAGAIFHGSSNWLPGDAPLPATSDLDLFVAHADANPPPKPGKFVYRGVILDVSSLPVDQLRSPSMVLGRYHLAGSFRTSSVIADPSGRLTSLQAAVASDYAKRPWVAQRCEDARDNVLRHLESLREGEPFHDQVTAWLFATGVTTHILLVAGLENPTVRRRYLAAEDLLADYHRLDFYETLLASLGCAQIGRIQVEQHLAALTDAFDAAKAVVKTPFFFASDISDLGRPIAIDGSRELIADGHHREAVFWIVATYARCQKIIYHDAPPAMRHRFDPGFRHLLGDLGITSFADLQERGEQVLSLLPHVSAVASAIMAANPAIEDA